MHTEIVPAFEIMSVTLAPGSPRCPRSVPAMKNFRDGANWMLMDDLRCDLGADGRQVVVPKGFVTDFASIPVYLRTFLGPTGPYSMAAVVHDFLYWDHSCAKAHADRAFRIAMQEAGVSAPLRLAMYTAVAVFGTGPYASNGVDRQQGGIRVVAPPDDDVPPNMDWDRYRLRLQHAQKSERKYAHPSNAVCQI